MIPEKLALLSDNTNTFLLSQFQIKTTAAVFETASNSIILLTLKANCTVLEACNKKACLTLELPRASIDVFSFLKLCYLKHTPYFLLKLFDFYFFADAHNLFKFQKVFVIRHRNKLTSTYNYQARQLTLHTI